MPGGVLLLGRFARRAAAPRAPDALPNTPYDGKFTFVRIRFNPGGMSGDGRVRLTAIPRWNHDYPRAEGHFGKLLSELSLVPTYLGGGNVLTFDDPELFKFPIAYLTEPGSGPVKPKETEGCAPGWPRAASSSWTISWGTTGTTSRLSSRWSCPMPGWCKLDVTIRSSIRSSASSRWTSITRTSRAAHSEFFGVFEDNDPNRRLMIVVNYNNDLAEYWECSDTDFADRADQRGVQAGRQLRRLRDDALVARRDASVTRASLATGLALAT